MDPVTSAVGGIFESVAALLTYGVPALVLIVLVVLSVRARVRERRDVWLRS